MQESVMVLKFVAAHYGFMILLGLVSYVIGLRLTRRIPYNSWWEEISVCVSLGLGVICYLVFMLGMLGALYPSVILLTVSACVAACYPVFRSLAKRIQPPLKGAPLRSKLAVSGLLLVLSIPLLALPLYPPTAFDETMYFLASAKIYAQNHQIIITPYLRFPVLTQLNEMLFTLGLSLYDDIAVHLIQLLMLMMLVTGEIAFCGRYFSRRAGWWAAAILLANPLVIWVGSVGYVDIAFMLFAAMASYAFFNWVHTREGCWLILSGAFCGFAASTKYPGLFFPLGFGIVTLYLAVRERRYWIPLRFAAVALAVMAPWYIRNFYHTGNPVFPFFPDIFGYSWWSAEDLQGVLDDLRKHGIGRSLTALVSVPWYLAFKQDVFIVEAPLSPLYFFALPILAVFSVKDVKIRKIVCAALGFALFWFFSSQVLRYILPAIPMMSVATAASLDMLLCRIPIGRRWNGHWIATSLIFGALIYGGWQYSSGVWRVGGPIPVTKDQRDNYLAQRMPSYPAYKMLNELRGKSYTVYSLYDESLAYYADGVHMGDFFGPGRYTRVLDKLSDGRALYEELKSLGVDYLLVNNQVVKMKLPEDSFFREHFSLIHQRGTFLLFDVGEKSSVSAAQAKQLLLNPSFEDVEKGWPTGWGHVGTPLLDTSGRYSYVGAAAVRCIGADNVFYQVAPIEAGGVYFLRFAARAAGEGQNVRMQVNWSDLRGRFLSTDLQVIGVTVDWNHYSTTVTAPPEASYAVVYVSCHENGSAWFDDVSFLKTQSQ